MRILFAALASLLLACTVQAGEWRAVTETSSVGFGAVQQRAKFNGRFHRFDAVISFDKDNPGNTRINASIDLGSVDTQYNDRDNMLAEEEWFHTTLWPTASYRADSAEMTETGLVASGVLTLRDISLAVPLAFTFTQEGKSARFTGSAELSRLAFGVGQGDWSDPQWVGDTITVTINLDLIPVSDNSAATPNKSSAE